MSRALVVGSAGQDGRILSEQLRGRGLAVTGVDRDDIDLLDAKAVEELVGSEPPAEIYYLAAHHHSSVEAADEDVPGLFRKSLDVHVVGLVHVLEAMRRRAPASRLFYASSSHVFGKPTSPTQDESTPRAPANVYAITKVAGMDAVRFYRESRGTHASSGILYNHESVHREEKFVTMRLVRAAQRAAEAKARGEDSRIEIGSLSALVDWGYAPDYTDAMQRIVAFPEPDDYVIATGRAHSVADFAEAAFSAVGLDWRQHVVERPGMVKSTVTSGATLVGNATKLRERTGWQPSVSFGEMVTRLVRGESSR